MKTGFPQIALFLLLATCQATIALTGNGTSVISGEIFPASLSLDYFYNPFIFPGYDNFMLFHYQSNGTELTQAAVYFRIEGVNATLNYSTYYGGYPVTISYPAINQTFQEVNISANASQTGYAPSYLAATLQATNLQKVEVKLYRDNFSTSYVNNGGFILAIRTDTQKVKANTLNQQAFGLMENLITAQNNVLSANVTNRYTYPSMAFIAPYINGAAVFALPNATQYTFIFSEADYESSAYYSRPTYTHKASEVLLGSRYITGDGTEKFIISEFSLHFWSNIFRYFILFLIFVVSLVVAYGGFVVSGNPTPLFTFALGIIPVLFVINLLLRWML
jgi:hypothetical protein